MQKTKKFQTKLIILLIILMSIPLIMGTTVSIVRELNEIEANVNQKNMVLAESLEQNIKISLDNVRSILDVLRTMEDVKEMNLTRMDRFLRWLPQNHEMISDIFIINAKGKEVYRTSGAFKNGAEEEYFKRAMQRQMNISNVTLSQKTGKPAVMIAAPIEKDREILGVIAIEVDLSEINTYISGIKVGETGYGFVVDGTGKVIAHPDLECVEQMTDVSDIGIIQQVIQGKKNLGEYTFQDVKKVAAYVPVRGTNWGVVVQVPMKELTKQILGEIFATGILLIGVIIFGGIAAYFVAKRITTPLLQLTEKMGMAAKGNIRAKVEGKVLKRKDEFGSLAFAFNQMLDINMNAIDKIKHSIKELYTSSAQLSEIVEQNTGAMEEVASGVNALANGSEQDTRQATNGMERVQQVAKGAENVAVNTEQVNESVKHTVSIAQSGAHMMNETAQAIGQASNSAEKIDRKMEALEKQSEQISGFVSAIISIADQTNLLALNAAIEAARAGEAGKGFAVVADQIRKLAEESGVAADKITHLVQSIQGEVNSASQMAESTSGELKQVVEKTTDTKKQIEQIAQVANQTLNAVEEIAAVTQQQASSSEELTALMQNLLHSMENTSASTQQMSASTQQQNASLEEMGAMAQELSSMASQLENLIAYFH